MRRPPRFTPRRDAGLYGFERALRHGGFGVVAGVDEAGRGACAGPLVVAAVILRSGPRGEIEGLADSKLLTPRRREEIYAEIVARAAAWSAVIISCHDIDRIGLHRCNIAGMRRAVTTLEIRPAYVLTDGFPVPGLDVPALAVPKGDRVAACVAAASVVAKVTRDRLMVELNDRFPAYGFHVHKGYITREHSAALAAHGPCPQHRFSFVNVARLNESQLDEARLDEARLDEALLDEARLEGARLDLARLDGARLDEAHLDEARLDEGRLDGARLDEGRLDGARLNEARVDEARLDKGRLDEASLDQARLDEVRLDGAGLDRARLDGTRVDEVPVDGTPDAVQRAVEAGMQENGPGAVGETDGYGAALEGVSEQVVVPEPVGRVMGLERQMR